MRSSAYESGMLQKTTIEEQTPVSSMACGKVATNRPGFSKSILPSLVLSSKVDLHVYQITCKTQQTAQDFPPWNNDRDHDHRKACKTANFHKQKPLVSQRVQHENFDSQIENGYELL